MYLPIGVNGLIKKFMRYGVINTFEEDNIKPIKAKSKNNYYFDLEDIWKFAKSGLWVSIGSIIWIYVFTDIFGIKGWISSTTSIILFTGLRYLTLKYYQFNNKK